jgi:hypothetical protein
MIAIAEPGFDDTVDRKWNRHGHEKHEQVLLEKAAKTLPDHHASAPPSDSDRTDFSEFSFEAGAARGCRGLQMLAPFGLEHYRILSTEMSVSIRGGRGIASRESAFHASAAA